MIDSPYEAALLQDRLMLGNTFNIPLVEGLLAENSLQNKRLSPKQQPAGKQFHNDLLTLRLP